MKRRLKTIGKNLIHAQFIFFQRFGIDILPRHFYSEIPDIDKLRRSTDWRKKYSMTGVVGANCDDQLQFLCQTTATNIPQQASVYQTACRENGEAGYGPVEAEFLLHYIVTHRPRSVVQVGAGVSTSVIRQAAAIAGYAPAITCFDPFPTDFLKRLAAERRITLLDIPAQQVDVDVLHQLDAGDLLFIDATHTLGPAGEVTRLVLEWLPRLKPGVRVHFHDITALRLSAAHFDKLIVFPARNGAPVRISVHERIISDSLFVVDVASRAPARTRRNLSTLSSLRERAWSCC
jgi:hypothetical protein